MTIIEELEQQVKDNPVLLYMKGSPDAPQCGFSSKASQILISCGKPFSFVDILSNPEIRANLPQFSNWPTFPQLFVNGELIGGCDIILNHTKREIFRQLLILLKLNKLTK